MAATFHLQVVSMDGLEFDGEVQRVSCRTIDGDLAIMARHCNYCTAIGMGRAQVILEDGTVRQAACIGGMLSMMNDQCRLIATTWEWSEEIDLERAKRAQAKAQERLSDRGISANDFKMAEAKLHRALVRINTAGGQR